MMFNDDFINQLLYFMDQTIEIDELLYDPANESLSCKYFILYFKHHLNLFDISFNISNQQKETAVCMGSICSFLSTKLDIPYKVKVSDDYLPSGDNYFRVDNIKHKGFGM